MASAGQIQAPEAIRTMAANEIKLLTGNSHPQLAKLVADQYADPRLV